MCCAHTSEAQETGWTAWNPPADDFRQSPIDLRFLNEAFAGQNGFIQARDGHFMHAATGQPVRFWGVNGPPHNLPEEDLKTCARLLAKYGVNLARVHYNVFDQKTGELKAPGVDKIRSAIAALKAEGIYSHLSIYFPLSLTPTDAPGWREGYDGTKHPFALLFFEPGFQELYQNWWRAILTSKGPDGKSLLEEPALMGIEIQNEDSFFFWTFNEAMIPDPQLRKLEEMFGRWAAGKYGSIDQALAAWQAPALKRDDSAEGRLAFRPLYEIFNRRTARDQDTAAFLLATQRGFYEETIRFLRGLGYRGLITASNWTTANNEILGPLEKCSYTAGDFIDRHGYWSCHHQGDNAAWSIRPGHTYSNRSAYRFAAEKPGEPPEITHPVMDPSYNFMPSMISETTWNRPNRYRGEAPLFYAAYGALQDTDALLHFALDGIHWQVKPGFFMQPWTLMSPTQIGQFPAAALIYRQGLVKTGELVADFSLAPGDIVALKGSPLVQQANLDELRKFDGGPHGGSQGRLDPLAFFAGRTNLSIEEKLRPELVKDLRPFINHAAKTVASTTGELKLDYGNGVIFLNAPRAQGAGGNLKSAGQVSLRDLTISSDLDLIHIVAVSLDGRPLDTSSKMLLQVMTEEKPSGFLTTETGQGTLRIDDIGHDPWLIREPRGFVAFKRPDASSLEVTPLDFNGYPKGSAGNAARIQLQPSTAYYLVEKKTP